MDKNDRQLLQTVLDVAYDGIVVVDKEGYITMMNKAYREFLGVKKAVGRHVTQVIENTRLHLVSKTGKEEIGELQEIKGRYIVATRFPIIKNGKVQGAIGKVLFRNVKELNDIYNRINKMEKEIDNYRGKLSSLNKAVYYFHDIIGSSAAINEAKLLCRRVANTNSNVLLSGESGTGKELFAHAIHNESNRRYSPFVKVNCAAIPMDLLESELFGYEKGAFTGAASGGKIGKFEMAHGGSIFLDEIGDMPFHMQVKLLRVIQEKEVERIGSMGPKKVDIRIICATNQDLEKLVKEGKFRADLYYRLNVVNIKIPSLRERSGDIAELTNFLIKKICNDLNKNIKGISNEAMGSLKAYYWPGNVRELENSIERAINLLEEDGLIHLSHLPKEITGKVEEKIMTLEQCVCEEERKAIINALKIYSGNKSKAAKALGISRSTLYEKMNKYKIL
ncbi:sigma-54 interaction domain-containing protein [Haloimpatiens massiliensis]|uniref:sigma-54 interaction domain-containing protein n=1 Tax=Haloimpatiens massiliensis TaxID=1658110 RepID=UPI000C83AE9A|nr:sigma 54-interacting transcriptional regulator [Haloimpatiens massiliensis]